MHSIISEKGKNNVSFKRKIVHKQEEIFIYIDFFYFLPENIIRNATVAVLACVGFLELYIETIQHIAKATVASILFAIISNMQTRSKQIKL